MLIQVVFSYVRTAWTPSKVRVCEAEKKQSKRQIVLHDSGLHLAVSVVQFV